MIGQALVSVADDLQAGLAETAGAGGHIDGGDLPPLTVKAKTTRGFPRAAHTSPAAPSMRASRAACTRPQNAPATSRAPRTCPGAPIRTAAGSARAGPDTGRAAAGPFRWASADKDAKRMPRGVRVNPQRLLRVIRAVIQQPGAERQRPLMLDLEVSRSGHRGV